MKKYNLYILIIILMNPLYASNSNNLDIKKIEDTVNKYEKTNIIKFILEKRYGYITTTKKNDYGGRPRKDLVTVNTILKDIKKLKMNTDSFNEGFKKYRSKVQKNEQRFIDNNYIIKKVTSNNSPSDRSFCRFATNTIADMYEYEKKTLSNRQLKKLGSSLNQDMEFSGVVNRMLARNNYLFRKRPRHVWTPIGVTHLPV